MNSFDVFFFRLLSGFAHKIGFFDGLIIFLANYFQYFLILIAVWLIFRQKNHRWRLFVIFVLILSAILSRGIVTETVRFFYNRPRPFSAVNFIPLVKHSPGGSLPSGHMAFYFVLALTIFLLNKKWGWFFTIGVILMGLARISAGLHWPSDILAGILVAILSYWIIQKLLLFKIRKELHQGN